MKQKLLVKHAVSGRMYIDSDKQDVRYSVQPNGKGWLFHIDLPWSDIVEELLSRKEELNVFLFQEYEDQPTLKTWYYVKDGPVTYDRDRAQLTIQAQSRIEYYPHLYSV